MNLDTKFLELRSGKYNRKNTLSCMFSKHMKNKCQCEKKGKKCFSDLKGKFVLNLEKLDRPEYLERKMVQIEFLYNVMQSVTQSLRSTAGKQFEQCLETVFQDEKKSYDRQIFISVNNIMYKGKPKNIKGHTVDFVSPKPKKYPCLLSEYKGEIISCKTTTRERVLQDLYFGVPITLITLEPFVHKNVKTIYIHPNGTELQNWVNSLK
jgi:hypothetical protein